MSGTCGERVDDGAVGSRFSRAITFYGVCAQQWSTTTPQKARLLCAKDIQLPEEHTHADKYTELEPSVLSTNQTYRARETEDRYQSRQTKFDRYF